jgi:hypothetical protein
VEKIDHQETIPNKNVFFVNFLSEFRDGFVANLSLTILGWRIQERRVVLVEKYTIKKRYQINVVW